MQHKGTTYLIDTICLIMNNEYFYNIDNLEKGIYPKIALKNKTNSMNIKNNIFKAIKYMYVENDIEKIKKYFSFHADVKPSAKLLINTIIKKIEVDQ